MYVCVFYEYNVVGGIDCICSSVAYKKLLYDYYYWYAGILRVHHHHNHHHRLIYLHSIPIFIYLLDTETFWCAVWAYTSFVLFFSILWLTIELLPLVIL